MLGLVFAFFVGVGNGAGFVAFEEEHLGYAFVGVQFCGAWGGVDYAHGNVTFPLRFERGYIDDNAAARIGGFAETDCNHVARYAKIFQAARDYKRVRGHQHEILRDNRLESAAVETFWIYHGGLAASEQFELVGKAHIVTIGRQAV